METLTIILLAAIPVAFAVGWMVASLLSRAQSDGLARERDAAVARAADAEVANRLLQSDAGNLKAQAARLEATLAASQEKIEFVSGASQQIREAFQSLSAEALNRNSESFLMRAGQNLAPLHASLVQVDERMRELEKARNEGQAALRAQIASFSAAQTALQKETAQLASALKVPHQRGQWGELQLRRVVELGGMAEHIDFVEQMQLPGEGLRQTPDLVVHLPGNRTVVVDSKVPADAYFQALGAAEQLREEKLAGHARAVREHIKALASRAYFSRLPHSPDFVVLFLPSEAFLAAALENDPSIIDFGVEKGVMLTTPTTLVSLMRMVAFVWREEQVAQNAKEIMDLGRELHERIGKLAEHFENLRKSMMKSMDAYNDAVGAVENRVMVSARRLKELGAGSDATPEVISITKELRVLSDVSAEQPELPRLVSAEKA